MTKVICKICQTTQDEKFIKVDEMMQGIGESFNYFQCQNCECLQIISPPDNIEKYYTGLYYSFKEDFSTNLLKKWAFYFRGRYEILGKNYLGKIIAKKWPNYALKSLKNIDLTKNKKIVDIGCGSGSLIYTLNELGFKNVLGIDPYIDTTIKYKNGTEIRKMDFTTEPFEGKWDIIMLHHVLEHIWEQHKTIQSIKTHLSEDGIAIIRIPTISSFAWEYYKDKWFQIDAPRHFFIHSINSLKQLVEKYDLKIINHYSDSDAKQFWISEQYQQNIPLYSEKSYAVNPSKSIFSSIDIENFKKKAMNTVLQ